MQNFVAAIRGNALALVQRADRVAGAAGSDGSSLAVGDGQGDAPIHPALLVGPLDARFAGTIFQLGFAPAGNFDLRGARAVFHQEVAHGRGAGHAQAIIIGSASDAVGMSFHLHLEGRVHLEQFGDA